MREDGGDQHDISKGVVRVSPPHYPKKTATMMVILRRGKSCPTTPLLNTP